MPARSMRRRYRGRIVECRRVAGDGRSSSGALEPFRRLSKCFSRGRCFPVERCIVPELPEVEIIGRNIRRWALGKRIRAFTLLRERCLEMEDIPLEALVGARVIGVRRRGKVLLIDTDGDAALIVHFGMTGKWVRAADVLPPFTRAYVDFDEGTRLAFVDMRCLGRIRLKDTASAAEVLRRAAPGIDPFLEPLAGARLEEWLCILHGRRLEIKPALMDQKVLAGVGNIYASEALFWARLSPRLRAHRLSRGEVARLARAIERVIREAIARDDGPEILYFGEKGARNPFLVYRREGAYCVRCAKPIQRIRQAGRSTFFCPGCQRED